MPTLRESLQAEIATAEADLATKTADISGKKAELAQLETTAGTWLGTEITEIRAFFHSVAAHIFPPKILAPVAPAPSPIPAVPLPTLPAVGQ